MMAALMHLILVNHRIRHQCKHEVFRILTCTFEFMHLNIWFVLAAKKANHVHAQYFYQFRFATIILVSYRYQRWHTCNPFVRFQIQWLHITIDTLFVRVSHVAVLSMVIRAIGMSNNLVGSDLWVGDNLPPLP